MKEEIAKYDEEDDLKGVEQNRGHKSIKNEQCLGRNNIIALKDEVMLIDDFDKMIRRCADFYIRLISTRRPQDTTALETTNLPPNILPSEV